MMMCQAGWSLRRGTDGLFPLPPTSSGSALATSGSALAVAVALATSRANPWSFKHTGENALISVCASSGKIWGGKHTTK